MFDVDDEGGTAMEISDQTGDKERSIRRQIYLTIMSSLSHEECAHKLIKSMGDGGHEVGVNHTPSPPPPHAVVAVD